MQFIKFREGKYKGEHGRSQVEAGSQDSVLLFCSSGAFETYRKLWEVENQVIPT
jgi:hypothetical protein